MLFNALFLLDNPAFAQLHREFSSHPSFPEEGGVGLLIM
jgi:hypothetical protein